MARGAVSIGGKPVGTLRGTHVDVWMHENEERCSRRKGVPSVVMFPKQDVEVDVAGARCRNDEP